MRNSDRDIIIERHHPELVRRMTAGSGPGGAATRTALTWNVFRTLQLIAPAFWLRRLRARLDLPVGGHAPTCLDVHLWPALPRFAPHIRDGVLDVAVETDTAVLGLVTRYRDDIPVETAGPDHLLQAIEATAWLAGRRECLVGIVTSDPLDSPVAAGLAVRYGSRLDSLHTRLGGVAAGSVGGVGLARWEDLLDVLLDCADTPVLTPLERTAAASAAGWLRPLAVNARRTVRTPSSFATA
jgi:hypothetical protein